MHSASKGQGAAEYLLLLTAVLVLTLLALGLLSSFPGQAASAQLAQSDVYWSQVARPFAISGSQEVSTGSLTLSLQNLDPEPRTITSLSVAGAAPGAAPVNGNQVPDSGTRFFRPGENKTVSVPLSLGSVPVDAAHPGCTPGQRYEYYVNITYSNADFSLSGEKEIGVKTLMGTCQ